MKKIPCQYSIIRFTPFIETGEFANAGVIMMAPNTQYFGFELLARRHGRITKFFDELDAKVFRSAMNDLKKELGRIHAVLKVHDFEFAQKLFAEILRPRETIIRFSEPRAILADDPKKTLNELFSFYVERNFVTKQYREKMLDSDLNRLFVQAQIGERFKPDRVGDEEFTVPFPFVELNNKIPTRVIKPLNLAQNDSTKILEHGGKWQFRIRELIKRDALPKHVLFAVDGSTEKDPLEKAYQEVVEMLTSTGVTVLPYKDHGQIIDFAKDNR
ncbi:MAG: DUF3037 domain-containing protein [Methylococcales bacterium]